jgi:DNA-binding NtrC family response regulator
MIITQLKVPHLQIADEQIVIKKRSCRSSSYGLVWVTNLKQVGPLTTIMNTQKTDLTGLNLLVVEDDPLLRRQIVASLEKLGADVTAAADLRTAREFIGRLDFDFVFLDLNLPDGLGLDLLRQKVFPANTSVVIMTANSNVQLAVEAMRLGALDYLVKPFNPIELPVVIARAQRARQSVRREEQQRGDNNPEQFFFGESLRALRAQLDKILAADHRVCGPPPPVLIAGETGTGKTTIARWLHHQGPRRSGPLVEVNCSALPESLAEAELFGHERGAFTDAHAARMGLFEAADGGTLFLDELPSLPMALQAKVLTALEDQRIRHVGGNKPIAVDVRLVAASNRDLKGLVASGAFREDLYHRLDLFRLLLPPLRERGEDTLRLAETLLARLYRKHRLTARPISSQGRHRLLSYAWPGNVRELAHELERAVVFEEGKELEFAQLVGSESALPATTINDWFNDRYAFPSEGFDIEAAVLRIIRHAMRQTGENMSAAARLLGAPRDYLRYRLERKGQPDQQEPTKL